MSVRYEWDALELTDDSDDADVVEHYHCDTLAEAIAVHLTLPHCRIELVRDAGSEASGITDRQWAMIERGRLPCEFDRGAVVPQRFHNECRKAWPSA